MSLNFNFLKNVNKNLYGLAKIIEENRSKSPEAVLCVGTTFLDNMVYDIYKIHNKEYEEIPSIQRVNNLENDGIISSQLADYIVDGFKIRNKMHRVIENVEGYIFNNKYNAKKLYKNIYKAAYEYYKDFYDKSFFQTYKDPDTLKEIFENNNKCPICDNKTKNDSIICSECDYDIELLDNLNSMIKRIGFKNNFSKNKMIEIGYDKSEAQRLLIDLKNKEVISKKGLSYSFNQEKIIEFREKIEDYKEIRDLVIDININDMSLAQIKTTETYIKGSKNQEPFKQFHELIFNKIAEDFEKTIENKSYIEAIELDKQLTKNEFIYWCKNNLNNQTLYNQLKNEYLTLKKQCKTNECIKEHMYIDDEILEILKKDESIKNENLEINKEKYLNGLITFKTFEKALEISGLKESQIKQFKKEDQEFREKYNEQIERRKNRLLVELKTKGFEDAFKASKLKEKHIEIEVGKKVKSEFYKEMVQLLQEKFLKARKQGKTKRECINICQIKDKLYKTWLNNNNFKNKLNAIDIELLFKSIENGNDLKGSLKLADLKKREFNNYIINAYDNDEDKIIELYETMVLPDEVKRYLEKFERKTEKDSLKSCKFDKKLLNIALDNDKELENRYITMKKIKYIESRFKNTHNKSLKLSDLTEKQYKKYEDEILNNMDKLRFKIVLVEISDGKTTAQAAKKAGVKVKDIYDWYSKGQYSVGKFRYFADRFERLYIKPHIRNMKLTGIDKNWFFKFLTHKNIITKEDVKFWRRHNIDSKFSDEKFQNITKPEASDC